MYREKDKILGDDYLKWEILCRIVLLIYSEECQPSEVVVAGYYE